MQKLRRNYTEIAHITQHEIKNVNYANITPKLRNVLRNSVGIPELSKHYANNAKITQITQVPKNYADYESPIADA